MAETLALTYARVYGLDAVAVRPGYVYGPGASTGGYYLDRAFRGEAVDEPVGGDLPMDVTYVRDLAEGIFLAATVRPLTHRLFNVTGGVLRRRSEVAELARQLVPGAAVRVGPGIAPGAHLRGPSRLERARAELGYAPRYTLEDGAGRLAGLAARAGRLTVRRAMARPSHADVGSAGAGRRPRPRAPVGRGRATRCC